VDLLHLPDEPTSSGKSCPHSGPASPPTHTNLAPAGRKSTTATTTHGQTLDDSDNEADSGGRASSPQLPRRFRSIDEPPREE